MIWVAWRQQRAQLVSLLVLLIVGGGAILVLRGVMQSDLSALGGCLSGTADEACRVRTGEFQDTWFDRLKAAQFFLLALPALLGMFCGAPLIARELEHGTHLLALTQSVGRGRWMATKFAVAAGPAVLVLVVLQLLAGGWLDAAGSLGPLAGGPYAYTTFGSSGVSPAVYVLFCLAVGMAVGALARRTLVAMSVTLLSFLVLRVALSTAQPALGGVERVVSDDPSTSAVTGRGVQVTGSGYLTTGGQEISSKAAHSQVASCGAHGNSATSADLGTCYREHGLAKSFADVLPAGSATTVHWAEAAVFAVLAAAAVLASWWALRRRV